MAPLSCLQQFLLRPIIRISSKTSTRWHHSSALFCHFPCSDPMLNRTTRNLIIILLTLTLPRSTTVLSPMMAIPFWVFACIFWHWTKSCQTLIQLKTHLGAPTLSLTRTTCDGTSLINCFGTDCWSNPTIVLVNGKGHTRQWGKDKDCLVI